MSLTPSEARLLSVLAAAPDRPVPRADLVRALWTSDFTGGSRACDTHVANLRRKLERDPDVLVIGEDVGVDRGVFRVTEDLHRKFGGTRVVDLPLGEQLPRIC